MKKTIILLSLFTLSFSAFSQAKKDTTQPKTDINAVPLFSVNDLNQLDQQILSELPAKYTDIIRAWLRERIKQKLESKK